MLVVTRLTGLAHDIKLASGDAFIDSWTQVGLRQKVEFRFSFDGQCDSGDALMLLPAGPNPWQPWLLTSGT